MSGVVWINILQGTYSLYIIQYTPVSSVSLAADSTFKCLIQTYSHKLLVKKSIYIFIDATTHCKKYSAVNNYIIKNAYCCL